METIAKKKAYHHGDLATALVEATLDLVWEFGPRGFSMSQAARSAGVSATAVYRHFESKEALLAEVARRGFLRLQERMRKAVETFDTPLQRLIELGKAYVGFAAQYPAQFEVMFMAAIDKHCFPETECEGLQALQILVDEVHLAAQQGYLKAEQIELAVQMTWSQVHGLAFLLLEQKRSGSEGPIAWNFEEGVALSCQNLLKSES